MKRIKPFEKAPLEHSVYVGLKSAATNLEVNLSASLAKSKSAFDDHIRFDWVDFAVTFSSKLAEGHLGHAEIQKGVINYSLSEGQMYTSSSNYLHVKTTIGPNGIPGEDRTDDFIKSWMRILDKFHSELLKRIIYLFHFYMNLGSKDADGRFVWLDEKFKV